MKDGKLIAHDPAPLLHVSLTERLASIREAADAAWAAKASSGFRSTVEAIGAAVKGFEIRAPEIAGTEDAFRLRAELADMLRSAAAAVAPRSI